MKRDRPASSLSEVWEGPERGIKRRVGLPDLSNDGTDTALGVVLAPEPEPQTQDLDASLPASPVLSRLRSGDLPTAYSTPARVRSKAPRPEPPTPTRALAQPQEEGAARCSTPQELVSPRRPHSPPPRPHKPSNSHASQTPPLKAPQHKMKSLTLLDLMDKLPMKPLVLRRLASTSNVRVPNRPKPLLSPAMSAQNLENTAQVNGASSMPSASCPATPKETQSAALSNSSPRPMTPCAPSPKNLPQSSTPRQVAEVPRSVSTRKVVTKPPRTEIAVDASFGVGMFHQASMSKLQTNTGSTAQGIAGDEWKDARYNPYEVVQAHQKAKSSQALVSSVAAPSSTPSHQNTSAMTSLESSAKPPSRPASTMNMTAPRTGSALNSSFDELFPLSSDDDSSIYSDISTSPTRPVPISSQTGSLSPTLDAQARQEMASATSATSTGSARSSTSQWELELALMFCREAELLKQDTEQNLQAAEAFHADAHVLEAATLALLARIDQP